MTTWAEEQHPLRVALNRVIGNIKLELYGGLEFFNSGSAEITSVSEVLTLPEGTMREYQSIIPLKGMFADDPTWDDLPEFLENYWREI
jgi:hypothetical protein